MKLKEYLDQNGWTANHFAKLTGLNIQTIINLLNGKKARYTTAQTIKKITGKKVILEIHAAKLKKRKYEKSFNLVDDCADDTYASK